MVTPSEVLLLYSLLIFQNLESSVGAGLGAGATQVAV